MNGMPDVGAVLAVAEKLGINLSPEEAELYHERVVTTLTSLEEFAQARIPEAKPEVLYPKRRRGYRPSAEEDRYNAWMWKCEISGADDGPLAGKTVSYKDHVSVAGIPLTFNAMPLEGFIPDVDATIVSRVLAAGGTVVGKNAMNGPTNGWGTGVPGDYARPLNPHDPEHVTGGSSSGSGAALAAREVDISFGGDQGGSIRIPAAWCGVYGIKPTFGLVSHFGLGFGSDQAVDHTGPMARTAEDMALAMSVVAGYDSLDPRQPREVPETVDHLENLTNGVKGLKLGILEEGFIDADPDVHDAVMAAVDVLVKGGAEATKVSIPAHFDAGKAHAALGPEGAKAVWDIGFFGTFAKTYYPTSIITATYDLYKKQTDKLMPRTKLNLLLAELSRRSFNGAVYAKAANVRPYFIKQFDDVLSELDALVMPTAINVAPKYEPVTNFLEAALPVGGTPAAARNTRAYDYTGHPALSVPVGKSGRLPIGMQLVGRYHDDALLLQIAYAFEKSIDFDAILSLD